MNELADPNSDTPIICTPYSLAASAWGQGTQV